MGHPSACDWPMLTRDNTTKAGSGWLGRRVGCSGRQGSKQTGSVGGFISDAQLHHQTKLLPWFSSKAKGAAVFIDPRLHLHGALRLIHIEAATA